MVATVLCVFFSFIILIRYSFQYLNVLNALAEQGVELATLKNMEADLLRELVPQIGYRARISSALKDLSEVSTVVIDNSSEILIGEEMEFEIDTKDPGPSDSLIVEGLKTVQKSYHSAESVRYAGHVSNNAL